MTFNNKDYKIVYWSTYHLKHSLGIILTNTAATSYFVIYTNAHIMSFPEQIPVTDESADKGEWSHCALSFQASQGGKEIAVTPATLGILKFT